MKLLEATKVNQWKKTKSSIEWFKFGLMLNLLSKIYHDDGLAVLKNENRLQSEQIKNTFRKYYLCYLGYLPYHITEIYFKKLPPYQKALQNSRKHKHQNN